MNSCADGGNAAMQAFGLFEYLTLQRERNGTEFCKRELIGPLRRRAGAPFPPMVKALNAPDAEARSAWAKALTEHCRECKGCRWAER